ncbi:L,D-transpeptidase family protein [Halomonas borealis]|uniref:L,D-transpeptidase family protein n=1 Tax=Halomonas borealis TaxID=2508710 RepID=UPI00109FCB2A|nr:L,D-transpeptidase family protein [Halomonas borealis]
MRVANVFSRYARRGGMGLLMAWLPITVSAATLPAVDETTASPPLLSDRLDAASPRLARFYALHGGAPVWQDREAVATLVELLNALEAEGLDPADYRPARLEREAEAALDPAASEAAGIRFDLDASRTLLAALSQLRRGRLDPHDVYPDWEIPVAAPRLDLVGIERALAAGDVEAALALARPQGENYAELRRALASYRHIARLGGWPMLPVRQAPLRPGDVDADIALLRRRLAMIGELEVMAADVLHYPEVALEAPAQHRYDATLEAAVKRFQRRHMLAADGVIGPRTRAALNVPARARIETLRANLERARWLSGDRPAWRLEVDLAGQRLDYRRPNGDHWGARVVVGQPGRASPVLRSEITYLTLNPTWTVPPTIMREDVLPRLRRDLGYLAEHDMIALDHEGRRLDPRGVDWQRPGAVMLRQRAGPRNPLGRMVLRFPNDHLVYLHDTPARGLFRRPQRALSSGCIRVENVAELTRLLIADSGSRIALASRIASGETTNVSLARPVPLALHYWTAKGESGGLASFRPDIYDRDPALIRALAAPAS